MTTEEQLRAVYRQGRVDMVDAMEQALAQAIAKCGRTDATDELAAMLRGARVVASGVYDVEVAERIALGDVQ